MAFASWRRSIEWSIYSVPTAYDFRLVYLFGICKVSVPGAACDVGDSASS